MSNQPPNLPPNRKSCFQITNVQEAASSITDDTESLDDRDESQTEDTDISRADLGVCDQSLSEGTLNNVGEHQEGQPVSTGPVNGGFSVKSGGGGVPVPPASQPSIPSSTLTTTNLVPSGTVPASVAQANPVSTGTMSTTTGSSRFRVIKIPFLRGRWTCTEFYGRDSDGSSIKHAVVLEHNVDRDNSRPGVTGGSVVIPRAVSADSGQSVSHHTHPPESLQPGYGLASQIGSGASALQPTGYSTAVPQHPQHAQINIPQTHPSSLNGDGASHSAMLQKSQIIPPTQQLVFSSQAGGITGGHPDHHQQQQFSPLQPQGSNPQNLPMASSSVGPPASQEPSPVITPVVPGVQGLGMTAQGGEAASVQGAHGGAPAGPPVTCSSQAEDSRRKSDALPQPSTGTLSGKVGMELTESLCLPDSLFGHAIANKLDQVLDVVKSNLMYAIREEMLKEKIKELVERNSALESENSMLKSLANTDQLSQLLNQISPVVSTSPPQQQQLYHHPSAPDTNAPLVQHEGGMSGSQQFSTLQPQGSNTQNVPMASFSVGPPASLGPSPDITPVGPGSQGPSMVAQGGEAASVQGLMLQVGSETSMGLVPSGVPPSAAVTPTTTTTIHSSVQNVTATVPPSTTHTPPDMLRQTPQPSTDSLSENDGMKPFISESLVPSTPTVESKFDIPIDLDGEEESTSDASGVAIDNKIEQALDLVKNHLTYAVRGEVEVLKEKIKVQYEKNSVLEHENALLKSLVNTDQLGQLSNRQPDYQQQQFAPLQPQGSSNQNLPMASLSVGPPGSQGPSPVITAVVSEAQGLDMEAQGRDAASAQGLMFQVGSGASMDSVLPGIPPAITTTHSSVQTATVPSTTNPPPGIQSAGGLDQAQGAHGGAPVGLPVGSSSQAEDSRQKSDLLPQPSTDTLMEKDGMKPFISESVCPLAPTVDSLFNIPIAIDGEEGSASHASAVAIDNKIELALDLVKSHLLNAVQEEVEVLKEQIKEQYGRNSVLEHENTLLKSLLNTDQLGQLSNQISPMVRTSPPQQQIHHHPSAAATTNNTSNEPLVQHEGGMSGSRPDYQQQQFVLLQPQGSDIQNLPMASLSARPPASQGPSPVITPAGPGVQGLGMEAQGGEATSAQGLMLQVGSVGSSMGSVPPGVPPTSVTPATTTPHSSVQNVTATVPSTTNTPPGMLSQASIPGGLVQALGACGGSLVGLPVDLSCQAEDSRQQKSAVLPQPSTDNLSVEKDGMKPFISEILGPPTPTVDSQFGIPIDIDGDEDSVSSASVVAIYKKVEQAMDLVKSHLMYAVQEEMEVLKEQIKDQYERNSVLEHENTMLKSLANTDQLSQLSSQISPVENTSPLQQQLHHHHPPDATNNDTSVPLAQHDQEQTAPPTSPTSHRHDPNPPPK